MRSDAMLGTTMHGGSGGTSVPVLRGKGKETADDGVSPLEGGASSADRVEEMIGRLRLTTVEAHPVFLDDEDEADLVAPDCALVGKVMSPDTLHIQTISSAMRPAWGNPKGLFFPPETTFLLRNLVLRLIGLE